MKDAIRRTLLAVLMLVATAYFVWPAQAWPWSPTVTVHYTAELAPALPQQIYMLLCKHATLCVKGQTYVGTFPLDDQGQPTGSGLLGNQCTATFQEVPVDLSGTAGQVEVRADYANNPVTGAPSLVGQDQVTLARPLGWWDDDLGVHDILHEIQGPSSWLSCDQPAPLPTGQPSPYQPPTLGPQPTATPYPTLTTAPSMVPQPTSGTDSADLAQTIGAQTVSPGQQVQIYIRIRNTGTTTWNPNAGYGFATHASWEDQWNSNALQQSVAPNGTLEFQDTVTAPPAEGGYDYLLSVTHNGQQFAGFNAKVLVVAAPVTAPLTAPPVLPTDTPVLAQPTINYSAGRTTINLGECATITWDVTNAKAVGFTGNPVNPQGSQQVCPSGTAFYQLIVVPFAGNTIYRVIQITVNIPTPPPAPAKANVSFRVDRTTINQGECVQLLWDVDNVKGVYLGSEGVSGHDGRQVCPTSTTTFLLTIVEQDNSNSRYALTVQVNAVPQSVVKATVNYRANGEVLPLVDRGNGVYWALEGSCVIFRWDVDNAKGVYFAGNGVGGHDSRRVCPASNPPASTYELLVVEQDNSTSHYSITIDIVPDVKVHILPVVPPCNSSADFNGDGHVDTSDYELFRQTFGTQQGDNTYNPRMDLNCDRKIDNADYDIFKTQFGK